jgi:hypothetical protein
MVNSTNSTLYGVAPSKVPQQDIKKTKDTANGMRFPIGLNTDGGYIKKSSGLQLIKDNLRQLLLTNRGERVMLPNFGTNIKKYLMEPLDQVLLNQVRSEILDSINAYARNIQVLKIQVIPGDERFAGGGNYLIINLFCALREQEEITFDVKVDLF